MSGARIAFLGRAERIHATMVNSVVGVRSRERLVHISFLAHPNEGMNRYGLEQMVVAALHLSLFKQYFDDL